MSPVGPETKNSSPTYTVLDWDVFSDRGHLYVEVKGFPGWVIEVVVMQIREGLAITDLHVHPWQVITDSFEAGTWKLGSRVGKTNEGPDSAWSELAEDVPAGGIPTRLIRAINTGQLLALAQRHAAEQLSANTGRAQRFAPHNPDLAAHYRQLAQEDRALSGALTKRPGRRGNGVDHYLLWAVRYAEKTGTGISHPIKELADEYGKTMTYVRDTVTDARRRYGFLTKPGQGKAGGTLTEKALALLDERQEKS